MPSFVGNGIEIAYERHGAGPRLLFLNGSGMTLAGSELLLGLFADGFDLVAADARGLGRSAMPSGPYAMADCAADAVALLDELGWRSARVVGISFGGMVAQEVAVTVPDRVERLALLCTSPGGPDTSSYPLHELEALPAAERAARATELLDTRFTPEWLAGHPADRALVEMLAARALGDKTPAEARGEALQLRARAGHDVRDRLGRITAPTLVASGRYDGIAPPGNGARIATSVPGAEQRVYEGGHAFFVQDPSALPDILAFLRG